MPAYDAIISCGTLPAGTLVDEPNILVQSLTTAASREEQEYKNADGATNALQLKNPKIEFQYDAYVSVLAGLANTHPGTQVASLLNFTTVTFGFDPADGCMLYLDPSREQSNEDLMRTRFTVRQYPFVA